MRLKSVQIIFCTIAMLLCASCGYRIGFIKHPQIDSLAVAPVINETAIYNAASNMRMMLNEVIMQDGTYKLSDQKRADVILFLTVKQVSFSEYDDASVHNKYEYKPAEWLTVVSVSYKAVVPGQGKPILEGTVTGSARFQENLDLETVRLRSTRQACYEAARRIIYRISEGW